jgi:hypothetical protein
MFATCVCNEYTPFSCLFQIETLDIGSQPENDGQSSIGWRWPTSIHAAEPLIMNCGCRLILL